MAPHDLHRAAVGRHTLGSPMETQEPVDPVHRPTLPAVPPSDSGAEPLHSIYRPAWSEARTRADAADPDARRLLLRMLDLVEQGWQGVRDLQRWYEDNDARAHASDEYAHLLAFVDGDVVDVFRGIAVDCAELVPDWKSWEAEADPDGVLGEIDVFVRYVALLRLAVQAESVPDEFGVLVASVSERLRAWGDELTAVVTAWATMAEARHGRENARA